MKAGEVTPGVQGHPDIEVTQDLTTNFVLLTAVYFPSVTGTAYINSIYYINSFLTELTMVTDLCLMFNIGLKCYQLAMVALTPHICCRNLYWGQHVRRSKEPPEIYPYRDNCSSAVLLLCLYPLTLY